MMQKIWINICCYFMSILGLSSNVSAQIFKIQEGSHHYDAILNVECQQQSCEGKAKITLYKKGTHQQVQTFQSDELTMYLDKDFKPSVNIIPLYNEQSPLIFNDFNFDETEDIAIRDGNYGAYGGPVYDVYVFNKTRKKFVLSTELSQLTQENLGMFQVDPKRKRIITFNKDGCCYHISSEYKVVPHKGLLLVRELIEDGTSLRGDQMKVTERKLVAGKWVESTKNYPLEQYYQSSK